VFSMTFFGQGKEPFVGLGGYFVSPKKVLVWPRNGDNKCFDKDLYQLET
jgi:hypothetical protein